MSKINYQSKTFRLVFSALMIALGTVLSITSIGLPLGGSITLGSMLPLVLLCQLYGVRWGAFSCTAYGLIQMLLGMDNFAYVTTIPAILAVALFDYLVGNGVMCLSGTTRRMKNHAAAAALGSVLGCACRFVCHFIGGFLVWSQWASVTALPTFLQNTAFAQGTLLALSYSFFYNLAYMLPETILTAVLSAIIVPLVRKSKALGGNI
ncbi:MAG: energy-coupled thiamine transporter ThiT [Clostridia bacterium]|nr:energy-coupled thiamine transporter ThiT [Clostridia bacterium]